MGNMSGYRKQLHSDPITATLSSRGKNLVRNFAGLGALSSVCDNNTDMLKMFE